MGREIKRVPAGFDAPLGEVWAGFVPPDGLSEQELDEWEGEEPPTGDWWQVWETVSEGSPVTPPFPTREELVDYLTTVGTLWDQQRGDGPWRWSAAEAFTKSGWAPSLVVIGDSLYEGGRDADVIEAAR